MYVISKVASHASVDDSEEQMTLALHNWISYKLCPTVSLQAINRTDIVVDKGIA